MPRTRFDQKPKRGNPLGELIFGALSTQGRTHVELAELLDVCPNTITAIKKDPYRLSFAQAIKICKFLGIGVDELREKIMF